MVANERREQAAGEAAEWWQTLHGEPTRAEREQFVDWLRESALHVAEMLRIAQVHGALKRFDRWSSLPPEHEPAGTATVIPIKPTAAASGRQPTVEGRLDRAPWRPVLAATLAALLIGVTWWQLVSRGQFIRTERGERRELALSDGSVLQVDPQTQLRVRYDVHARRVVLVEGRALFHVAKNAARPFYVQVGETTVRAVGTAFAVERDPDSILVTVAEGKVAVSTSAAAPAARNVDMASPATASGSEDEESLSGGNLARGPAVASGPIFLTASEQVRIDGSTGADPVRHIDTARALAWAEGRLVFNNDTVEYVLGQFNRYNRIQLVVNDAALKRKLISGVFDASDPESFVAFIQDVAPVRVSRDGGADISIDSK